MHRVIELGLVFRRRYGNNGRCTNISFNDKDIIESLA